jgi:hypothetical protein
LIAPLAAYLCGAGMAAAAASALVALVGQNERGEWLIFLGSFALLLPAVLLAIRRLGLPRRPAGAPAALSVLAAIGLVTILGLAHAAQRLHWADHASALILLAGSGALGAVLLLAARRPALPARLAGRALD